MTLHFLKDVVNDAESTQKSKITSLLLAIGKLINRIPGSRILITSLPSKALRTLVDITFIIFHPFYFRYRHG